MQLGSRSVTQANCRYAWVVDLDSLRASPIGQLVPINGTDVRTGKHYDHCAYLPDPLPREISLTSSTWNAVAKAEAALGRLDQAARQIPTPGLLRQPALRREAQSTSALEGTFAPIEEVLESDLEDRERATIELREILNYVAAAEEAFAWIEDRPLTSGLLASLQGILVRGTSGDHADAGRVRDRQVFIGARNAPVEDARFIPPPPGDQLQAGLEDWIDYVERPPADVPAVVAAALAHYQFETLHPFSDGNGRIGRLVVALQFMRYGTLREPILVVSPWLEDHREEYQDGMLNLTLSGNWSEWVAFFAMAVEASATTTRERVDRLLEWQEAALVKVREAGVSGIAERVAGQLIGTPILRAAHVAEVYDCTQQAAMNALRRLRDLGLLTERGGKPVVFQTPDVIELLKT